MKPTAIQRSTADPAIRGVRKAYGDAARARRRGPDVAPRRGARAARPQRRRQDDPGRDPRGPPPRRRRRGPRARLRPRARERAFRERIGIVLQEAGLDPDDQRPRGGRALRRRLPAPAAGRRGARAGRARPTAPTPARRRSPAASAAGSTSRSGIVGDPELLFLDEPTTGFDPAARRQSWELIAGCATLGKTILLTTHYMDEAQHLADRVVVLAQRPRRRRGHAGRARPRRRRRVVGFRVPAPRRRCRCPAARASARGRELPHRRRRRATSRRCSLGRRRAAWSSRRLTVTRPTLEDVYLELTEEAA